MTVVIALRIVVRPIQRTLQGALFTTLLFWNRLTGGTLKSEADHTFFFFFGSTLDGALKSRINDITIP